TSRGIPAEGVVIELHAITNGDRRHILTTTTDARGRTNPVIFAELNPGVYELTFHAGDYFRNAGIAIPDPPFLDVVTIRFGVTEPKGHYHVPLLLSPYGYTTYRGS